MRTRFSNILKADTYLDYYFDGEVFIDNTPISSKNDKTFSVSDRMRLQNKCITQLYKIKAKSTQKQVGELLIVNPKAFGVNQKMCVHICINSQI